MVPDASSRDGLMAALPSLRAFAISLVHDPVKADDLVQDTVVRAWAKAGLFTPGTNLNAWLFTILRNRFYSDHRKRRLEVEDPDETFASRLSTCPDQQAHLDYTDFRVALAKLRPDQREALILVGAEGLSYGEAAAICGVPVGTVKSRVNRARLRLHELLHREVDDNTGPDGLTLAALGAV